jgi:hypothetical protein
MDSLWDAFGPDHQFRTLADRPGKGDLIKVLESTPSERGRITRASDE